jgi:hypothetical protein
VSHRGRVPSKWGLVRDVAVLNIFLSGEIPPEEVRFVLLSPHLEEEVLLLAPRAVEGVDVRLNPPKSCLTALAKSGSSRPKVLDERRHQSGKRRLVGDGTRWHATATTSSLQVVSKTTAQSTTRRKTPARPAARRHLRRKAKSAVCSSTTAKNIVEFATGAAGHAGGSPASTAHIDNNKAKAYYKCYIIDKYNEH